MVVALSHLLLVGSVILFADSVAETALALGGPFCHRLSRLIDLDSPLASVKLLRLPEPEHGMSRVCIMSPRKKEW